MRIRSSLAPAASFLTCYILHTAWAVEPAISAGGAHSLFLAADSTIWGQGDNLYEQLGAASWEGKKFPTKLSGLGSDGNGYKAISASGRHSLSLTEGGRVHAYGNEDGTRQGSDGTKVDGMTGVIAVAAGGRHSLVLKNDGTVWGDGDNSFGQLGNGTESYVEGPIQIMSGVVKIAAGGSFSIFMKRDGSVWATGSNSYGQLGDGTQTHKSTPVRVLLPGVPKDISAGGGHSLFLLESGEVVGCGANSSGQLGNGVSYSSSDPFEQCEPIPVPVISNIKQVSAGAAHSLFVSQSGSIWACGRNAEYQLGDGTTTEQRTPVNVTPGGIMQTIGFKAVSAGYLHSLFLDNNDGVWMTGGDYSIKRPLKKLTQILTLPPPSPELDVQSPRKNSVSFSTLRFGQLNLATRPNTKTIFLRNSGEKALTILGIKLAGKNNRDFRLSRFPTRVPPNSTAWFKVTFNPRTKGHKTAVLRIRSNDADEGSVLLYLEGTLR